MEHDRRLSSNRMQYLTYNIYTEQDSDSTASPEAKDNPRLEIQFVLIFLFLATISQLSFHSFRMASTCLRTKTIRYWKWRALAKRKYSLFPFFHSDRSARTSRSKWTSRASRSQGNTRWIWKSWSDLYPVGEKDLSKYWSYIGLWR